MAKKIKKITKKTAKKTTKKVAKKNPAKKAGGKKKALNQKIKKSTKKALLLGVVTHYYGGIGVGIIKCTGVVKAGAKVQFKGATTDFTQTLDSMEYDRKPIAAGKRGQEVGVKVRDRVREGDEVYAVK